jgi:signal transduction histidine kinase
VGQEVLKPDEDHGSPLHEPKAKAKRSIAWRILLGSSAAVVVALLLTGAYFLDVQHTLLDRSFRSQSQVQTDWIGTFALEHLVGKDYPALEHAIAEAGLSDENILAIEVFHDGYPVATFRRRPNESGVEFRSEIKWRGSTEAAIGEVRAVFSTAQRDRLLAQGTIGALVAVLTIYVTLFFALRYLLRRAVIKPVAELISRTDQEIARALPEAERPGAPAGTTNEIEVFDQRFTALLEGLKRRDQARDRAERKLIEHRDTLERQIEERTRSLRVAQEEAQRLNLAKSEFLAAASHDLRQPLQAIKLFHSALVATRLDEQQRQMTDYLSFSLTALGELLDALLDISKLDAGLITATEEAVPVDRVFEKIDAEFSSLAREKGLRFKFFFPASMVALRTDGHLLHSMLGNLIGNAIKYTERGGILVSIRRRRGGRALVQVWDTGLGIPEEFHERIFDEYFQIGNQERDRAKGVGLGLSIVRRLSRLLRTEVQCRSRPGRGTVFQFTLPLAGAEEAVATIEPLPMADVSESDDDFAGSHIVVVEDDLAVATAIQLACEARGMKAKVHANAESVLTDPAALRADYFLFDYRLPGINGLQLLDRLRRRADRRLNAVVLTGELASGEFAPHLVRDCTVLFKPVDFGKVLQAWRAQRVGP